MAVINLSKMQGVEPINISIGDLTDSKGVINTMFQTANDLVGGVWFEGGMVLVFLALFWIIYKRDGDFIMDSARSGLVASAFTLLISIAIVLSEWTVSIKPVIWFGTLFFVTGIMVFNKKEKNL